MDRLRVAAIGSGVIARGRHIPAYLALEGVEVVAVVDTNVERAKSIAAQFNIPKFYEDYPEMLDHEKPDLVSICTPPSSHAAIAIAAVSSGAHVICEKPMATSALEGEAMIKAAQETNRLLTVVFNLRYTPQAQALKQFVDDGRLGEPYFARVCYTHPAIPSYSVHHIKRLSGGGPLITSAVHTLDLTLWLMGFPKPVSATAITYQKFYKNPVYQAQWKDRQDWPDVEDFLAGFVRFENGAALQIETDWLALANRSGGEVVGAHGEIHFDPYQAYEVNAQGRAVDVTPEPPGEWNGHDRLIADVIDCIRDGRRPLVKAEEALYGQRIIDALYASAASGRETLIIADGGEQ
jgi:predicted dehydrogenase